MRRGRCRLRIACSRRHPRTTGGASAAAPRPLSSASHHAWPLPSPLAVLAPHSLTAWIRPPEGNLAPPPQPTAENRRGRSCHVRTTAPPHGKQPSRPSAAPSKYPILLTASSSSPDELVAASSELSSSSSPSPSESDSSSPEE
uniref:Uncharacterized protein n=1 Tax=Triticum urartu TaxID=4572 RepID=A0A8R7QBV9_TRIUA